MKQKLLLAALVCTMSLSAFAQFSMSGEINARSEFRNGFKSPKIVDSNPAFFIEQRSRLYTNFKSEKFEVQLSLQDIRIWGANGQIYKSDYAMTTLSEGWGRYYLTPAVSFKMGRQIISYDNQRFFGGLEWAMQGRRHDALLFLYEKNGLSVHTGFAFNQPMTTPEPIKLAGTSYPPGTSGAYSATGNYKHLEYAWINKKYENANLSIYLVNDGRQYGSTQDSISSHQTYGIMGMKKVKKLTLNGELFYQGGMVGVKDLSAYMFSLSASLATPATPITLGYDRLSGTVPGADKVGSFSPDFGTNHSFYGFMDYFYVGNAHSAKGLQDFYLNTKFKLAKGALTADVHYFLSAVEIQNETGEAVGSSLGTEVDLVYVQKFADQVTFKLGYSQLFATESMDLIKAGDNDVTGVNNWAWAQLIFTPKFL